MTSENNDRQRLCTCENKFKCGRHTGTMRCGLSQPLAGWLLDKSAKTLKNLRPESNNLLTYAAFIDNMIHSCIFTPLFLFFWFFFPPFFLNSFVFCGQFLYRTNKGENCLLLKSIKLTFKCL